MKHSEKTLRGSAVAILSTLIPAVLILTVLVPPLGAQAEDPVTISIDIAGRARPARTLTATATVEIQDGSTLESMAWTQVDGVPVNLRNANTAVTRVVLGAQKLYRERLFHILAEPPIGPNELPPGVHPPEGEFPGGLQDRFGVVGVNPWSLEETGLVTLELEVITSSGSYVDEVEIHTELPWRPSPGLRNVPVGRTVLLHGKNQDSYNWSLTPPAGSKATISRTAQNPTFKPDIPGRYEVRVTDQATSEPVVLDIYAGTWKGVIVAQDEDGRPVANGTCTACHREGFAPAVFEEWAQTGHAEIFTDNLNTSTHYGERCFDCHMVGFDPGASNGGVDEASDYQEFLDAGLINSPGNNWTEVLDEFPDTAQMANVQCESCHGPQSSEPGLDTLAHGWRSDITGTPRASLSSDVCAVCHGEPLRHARFQQWQISAHANYELAIEESQSGNCSRCHTANGFLTWLPVLLGDEPGDPTASIEVTWTADEAHAQTCVTCHDPHNIGTTSGIDTNATVPISGDTPNLIAGFQVLGAGRGAICMTCHNSRRGLRNDQTFGDFIGTSEVVRAPHGSAQTDVLMGENAYMVNVGVRGRHSLLEDTCVACHMEATPPPDQLSYNKSGTNHTFAASPDICTKCHEGLQATVVQDAVEKISDHLLGLIESALADLIATQTEAGFTVDFGGGTTVTDAADITDVAFAEFRGRQAVIVTLADDTVVGPVAISSVDVIMPAPLGTVSLDTVADPKLLKAGWNWALIHNDGSRGAHNPSFVLSVLDAARDALGDTGGPRSRIGW